MTDVRKQRVLITGAASGLDKLLAHRLGLLGAELVLWDINAQGLTAIKEELEGHGIPASTYVCDLNAREAIAAVAAEVLSDHGGIDVLINNAGVVTGKSLTEASDEDILLTFNVNSLALFWTSRAFLPGMLERNHGHIVTIASAAGLVGTARLVDYCASKFAAVGFNEALRLELKRQEQDIKTTVVCPYYIDTGMFSGVKTRFASILPILAPGYVVELIVSAIQHDKPRVVTPRFVMINFLGRLLPVRLFDALMDFFGISKSMDEFTGRPGH